MLQGHGKERRKESLAHTPRIGVAASLVVATLLACGVEPKAPADAETDADAPVLTESLITTVEGGLSGLAVAGDTLVVATAGALDEGRIITVPAGGGAPTVLVLDAGIVHPTRVAVDETHVYWADYYTSRILRVPLGGGASQVVTEAFSLEIRPTAIAIDGENVFWGAQTVYVAPKSGGSSTPVGPGAGGLVGIEVDDHFVYAGGEWLVRMPKDPESGEEQTTLTTMGDRTMLELRLEGGELFYSARGNSSTGCVFWRNTVMRLSSTDGGDETSLVSSSCTRHGLAVTDSMVFWVNDGELRNVGRTGGAESAVATDVAHVLAADGSAVYFGRTQVEDGTSTIHRASW